MLFRSLFVLSGFGKFQYTFDSQKETDELMRKLAMDFAFLIRLLNPSRVIIAVDDKSWRKSIQIEENEGYKGHRKQNEYINWDNVFGIYNEFLEIFENNGMIVTKIATAEGDDTITLWRDELLFNQQQHVILVSGDEDIRQLVAPYMSNEKKKIFATVFNPFMQGKNAARKLYVPEKYFIKWLNEASEGDIWNMNAAIEVDKGDFCRIRDTEKVRVEEINGLHIAMKKVFCGDDGDNIPSIYTWMAKTAKGDDKEVRITNAKFEKIYESLQNSPNELVDHYDLMERKDKIKQGIHKFAKHDLPFDIEERLKRQIKLVVLDKTLFPKKIVEDFDKTKEEQLAKPRPDIGGINMNSLLQGTRYVKASRGGTGSGDESSIFKEIDRLSSSKQLF